MLIQSITAKRWGAAGVVRTDKAEFKYLNIQINTIVFTVLY